ncbi:hypothetical protein [Streptomyces sp. NPDC049944]|uniref:hypothetical protein n=1 Tax=Streptomyces sp. NPDC049944 TaxID=3155657 RepID=UPI0034451033
MPRWQDSDGSDLWVSEDETRDQVIGLCRRTWEHSDATINCAKVEQAARSAPSVQARRLPDVA